MMTLYTLFAGSKDRDEGAYLGWKVSQCKDVAELMQLANYDYMFAENYDGECGFFLSTREAIDCCVNYLDLKEPEEFTRQIEGEADQYSSEYEAHYDYDPEEAMDEDSWRGACGYPDDDWLYRQLENNNRLYVEVPRIVKEFKEEIKKIKGVAFQWSGDYVLNATVIQIEEEDIADLLLTDRPRLRAIGEYFKKRRVG